MKNELIERLTRYVMVDTQANEENEGCPSTEGQLALGTMLVDELKSMGMTDVSVDENGYVMGTLEANVDHAVPTIGFIAHLDTAPDYSGKDVKPQLLENYGGGDILLNKEKNITMAISDFPELENYKGHTLITTDGTTLLGADDKAGITEIMTAMHYLITHPEIPHGKIRVAFTPDEEIGRGAHKFDVARFSADYAYTVDGGPLGELEYESFNAAGAKVTFHGVNVHPGTAKGKMRNALKMAMEFNGLLPFEEAPEHTTGYDGFFHILSLQGSVEKATASYIIRDFDKEKFQSRKEVMQQHVSSLCEKYGEGSVEIEMKDQYFNMKEKIEPVKEIVDLAFKAMENQGVTPIVKPIRGGTDGSQLSFMGLPTPNIFTGGENFHGRFEYISVDNMEKATNVIVEIAKLFTEERGN